MLFAGWEVRIVKNCDQGLARVFLQTTEGGHGERA